MVGDGVVVRELGAEPALRERLESVLGGGRVRDGEHASESGDCRVVEGHDGDEGAYGKEYASEGDAEALRNDKDNDRSHCRRFNAETVKWVSVAQSRPLGLHLFTARPPPPTTANNGKRPTASGQRPTARLKSEEGPLAVGGEALAAQIARLIMEKSLVLPEEESEPYLKLIYLHHID